MRKTDNTRFMTRDQESPNPIVYRSMSAGRRFSSLNEEKRSVDVIAATENPVRIFDYDYGMIDEVLLMSGAVLPGTRQIPLLDSHQRYDTSTVIGSAQGLRVEGDQLVGTAYFSERSEGQWSLVKEKHLTDFSVGYRVDPKETVYIAENETGILDGREWPGPVLIRKKWYPKELSLVPIGADEMAKARAEYQHNHAKKENAMNEKLRKWLEARGLAKDATEAQAWAYLETLDAKPPEAPGDGGRTEPDSTDIDQVRREATGAERERITAIDAMCRKFACEDMAEEMIRKDVTVDQARAKVMEKIQARYEARQNPGYTPATVEADAVDKFRAAAVDHLIPYTGAKRPEKPAPGADELRGWRLSEIAREVCRLNNQSDRGSREQVFQRAVLTGDLSAIFANVANKVALEGFETEPETWRQWCQIGSANDFKTSDIARMGHVDTLEETPDGTPIRFGSMADGKEQYALKTYTKKWAIGRQAIINDDLNVFSDLRDLFGSAAARTVGDVVYAVLTANANMGDGVALFHAATHSNLASSAGPPGMATWAATVKAMATQTDVSGKQRLNIRPAYFIGPWALQATADIFFGSRSFSDSDTVATDSSLASTRDNIYYNAVQRVFDARLDDDSTTAWYAAAANRTVRVFFLNGQQSPTVLETSGTNVLGMEYTVFLDVAAKAVDWVGLYKNAGA